jgi:hypothetical protein
LLLTYSYLELVLGAYIIDPYQKGFSATHLKSGVLRDLAVDVVERYQIVRYSKAPRVDQQAYGGINWVKSLLSKWRPADREKGLDPFAYQGLAFRNAAYGVRNSLLAVAC